MVNFYAEITRIVGFRDDNWKPLASNDPVIETIGWFKDPGLTATSDGDILSLSGSSGTAIISKSGLSVSGITYPKIVVRAKTVTAGILRVGVFTGGAWTDFDMSVGVNYATFTIAHGKTTTITDLRFYQTTAGLCSIDYVTLCGLDPMQLSETDLVDGESTRASLEADIVNLRLNNLAGKFTSGSSDVGFTDHLRIWLPRQGESPEVLYRTFGGTVEWEETFDSTGGEIIELTGKGWASALQQIIVTKEYLNQTPRQIINDVIDTFVNAAGTNYQITRSYVQDRGSAIGFHVFAAKYAWDGLKEIGDFLTAQGSFSEIFVDPSENLHLVPLGPSGSPSWGTDPFSATYGTAIEVGVNQILNRVRRDIVNLKNRVHYFGIVQHPADGDAMTEATTGWAIVTQNNCTVTLGTDISIKKVGTASVTINAASLANVNPWDILVKTPNFIPFVDLSRLGSKRGPALLEFYIRVSGTNGDFVGAVGQKITDQNTTYAAPFNSASTSAALLGTDNNSGGNKIQKDTWYHVIAEIGPFATESHFTGAPPSSLTSMHIKWAVDLPTPSQATSVKIWIDGLRVFGGRYRMAYDNRASPPIKERREIPFWDPVSKDDNSLKNIAKAELLRLRDPVRRASFTVPIRGDLIPGQRIQTTAATAGLSLSNMRVTKTVHRFSQNGFITDIEAGDDWTNSQPLEVFRLQNLLLQSGHPGVKDREVYDLKTASIDPSLVRFDDPYT